MSVGMRRRGTFGILPAEIATSLVMVLNELLLNAVEHGFRRPTRRTVPSRPRTRPARGRGHRDSARGGGHRAPGRKQLHVTVTDNGRGLPEQLDAERGGNLGLQIVRALVTGELRGTIELRNGADGGTEAAIVVPLARGTTDRLTGRAGPP
ncbi:ATP-binding protein [Micromonospora sp. BRA006-A]|nr:ATP-binding protein [Micromonospora sp. BRA006-A]